MTNRRLLPIVLILIATCTITLFCVGIIGGYQKIIDSINSLPDTDQVNIVGDPTNTPYVIRPVTPTSLPKESQTNEQSSGSTELLVLPQTPDPGVIDFLTPIDTLNTLQAEIVPVSDLLDIARRLEGKNITSNKIPDPLAPYQVDAKKSFWVLDTDSEKTFQIETTLQYLTDHAYFWIEKGLIFDQHDLENLANEFERKIFPTNRLFFGTEWSPGVDEDPRLHIVYTSGLGGTVAGLFSPGDEYPPLVSEFSNGHEMFLLNADRVELHKEFTYGVLAHEFQHMIHWYQDVNEESWLNEGFSELAMFLNNYNTGGVDELFASNPDVQLNDWPESDQNSLPHYGASFLFLTYFLDRFGENITRELISDQLNGLVSIDNVLLKAGITDPLTGEQISSDDVFADWALASYLLDKEIGDGRYTYHNYDEAPKIDVTEEIESCPIQMQTRDVSQYGTDYIRFTCSGQYTLNFEGSIQVPIYPSGPHSGNYAFWSNLGDASDMTITRYFDFRDQNGPLTLNYWTWYDVEDNYDYVYLLASEDGKKWDILTSPSGTPEDPNGNNYGWAYTGQSNNNSTNNNQPEWINESVDISKYAGKSVYMRFEYITDSVLHKEGFLLDDVSIPEINYFTDFEDDNGGWQGEGFVRIQNVLPQNFRIALIRYGGITSVEQYSISGDNSLSIPIEINDYINEVILVVSGTTRFTHQKAAYRFSIE